MWSDCKAASVFLAYPGSALTENNKAPPCYDQVIGSSVSRRLGRLYKLLVSIIIYRIYL